MAKLKRCQGCSHWVKVIRIHLETGKVDVSREKCDSEETCSASCSPDYPNKAFPDLKTSPNKDFTASPKVCPRCNSNDYYDTKHSQYHCRRCDYYWDKPS